MIAGGLVVVGCVALSVVVYMGLLIYAAFTNGDWGGPLALPFMMSIAFLGSLLSVVLVIAPVTLIAQFACRNFHWHRLAQIPLCILLCLIETLLLYQLLRWFGLQEPASPSAGILAGLILLIPLFAYWSILQAGDFAARLGLAIVVRLRSKTR